MPTFLQRPGTYLYPNDRQRYYFHIGRIVTTMEESVAEYRGNFVERSWQDRWAHVAFADCVLIDKKDSGYVKIYQQISILRSVDIVVPTFPLFGKSREG